MFYKAENESQQCEDNVSAFYMLSVLRNLGTCLESLTNGQCVDYRQTWSAIRTLENILYKAENKSQQCDENICVFYMLSVLRNLGTYLKLLTSGQYVDYRQTWLAIRTLANRGKPIFLSNSIRKEIESFIYADKIEKLKQNIFSYLNPGQAFEDADEAYVNCLSLSMLDDMTLVKYFAVIVGTISFAQRDNLLLVKYSKTIFNTGWHKVALYARGKVIDTNTMEIVSYPFDKFFNLGEVPENSTANVCERIKNADNITVTEKKDGSLIIVTRLKENEEPLINTNGSLDNDHIRIAKRYLKEKYNFFYEHFPVGLTCMFELISPEDLHLIKYNGEERMYLLGARCLPNCTAFAYGDFKLIPYKDLCDFAKEYHLDIVPQETFSSLDEFVKKTKEKGMNKEGWVFRISKDGTDYMFKLKYEEYFILHRMSSGVSIIKVYKLLLGNGLNEFIENAPEDIQESVISVVEEINIVKNKACEYAVASGNEMLKKYGYDVSDFSEEKFNENKAEKIEFIQKAIKSDRIYGSKIVNYIKMPERKNNLFDKTNTNTFKALLEQFE